MIRKTRFTALLITVLFSLGILAGCGSSGGSDEKAADSTPASDSLNVVATIFPDYDMAREVIGDTDHVSLSMLMPPGADAHTYELKPEDIKAIKNADVFIYTGDEMEPWVAKVREQLGDNSKTKIVDLSKSVDLTKPAESDALGAYEDDHDGEDAHDQDAVEHEHDHDADAQDHDKDAQAHDHDSDVHEHDDHEHDGDAHEHDEHDHDGDAHEHHHHHHTVDPHIWTSLKNAQAMTTAIADALAEADGDHADAYKANADAYKEKLAELDKKYTDLVQHAKRKTIVVADEFPFLYFARDYGLDFVAAFDSCDEHAEPGAQRVALMQDYIKENHIPVIYHTELAEPKIAKKLSDATGAKLVLLNAAHTMSAEDMKAGKTYLDIMTENLDALDQGLNG